MHTSLFACNPQVLLFSGSSGSGKGRLISALNGRNGFKKYRTRTSRPRRADEIDGEHYDFDTREGMHRWIVKKRLLEWAEVHDLGHIYGTPCEPMLRSLESGARWLLEVNVDGHDSIRRYPNELLCESIVSFFLKVPRDSLVARILKRQPDIEKKELDARIASVEAEEKMAERYDYTIEHLDGQSDAVADRVLYLAERRAVERSVFR
jgi:guanylate kinase